MPDIDLSKAIDLRINHGLTYKDIGDIFGTSKQAVHQKIKHLIPTPETKTFQEHRADILSKKQLDLLTALDDKTIKKMQGRDLVVATGILYDKERLERGLSTGNFATITADIESIRAARHIQEPDSDPELT